MEPLKILGISKSQSHDYWELEKKQKFFFVFRSLLINFGFGDKSSNAEIYSFGRPMGDDGEPILSEEKNISDYVDKHSYFENKEFNIDVIFGKERIFLVINSKKDGQEEISEKVQKFCSF